MGAVLCSQYIATSSKYSDFIVTKEWSDFEIVVSDEEESINSHRLCRTTRSMPYPSVRSPGKITKWKSAPNPCDKEPKNINKIEKTRTDRSTKIHGFSLEERMKKWHQSSVTSRRAESVAKQYADMVQDDSLRHLHQSIRVTGSILQKGNDINQELARQQELLRKTDNDLSIAEYETDQTNEKLRGIRSISGKLASVIRWRKPKLKVQTFSNLDMLSGEIGLYSLSNYCAGTKPPSKGSLKDTKQEQLKSGIEELHTVLDLITVQQMDAAWALNQQEKHLSVLEDKTDRTQTKIKHQCQLINSIASDS